MKRCLPLSRLLCEDRPAAQPVAYDGRQQYNWADFRQTVAGLTAVLETRPETRWLLIHDDSYRFAIGLLALLAAGKAVVLPANAQPGTLAGLHGEADALLGHAAEGWPALAIPTAAATAGTHLPLLDAEALSITVLTSGSTGVPKVLRKPLRCFEQEVLALERLWGERLGDAVLVASVSHQHIYGLLFRLLWPLCAGRPFPCRTQQYPEPMLAALQAWPRSVLVSSPSQLKRFPEHLDLAAASARVAAVFSSGGPLPAEAALDWQRRLGQAPIEVLGSSETGGIAWRQQRPDAPVPWQPFAEVQTRIETDGRLQVRSPFTGQADWLPMGDRAQADGGGFQLLGRADAIVKIEEKRLSLPAMEQHLQQSALVQEARVIVLTDEPGRLGAVVVPSAAGQAALTAQGRRAFADRLRTHLLAHYERVLLPRKWRFPAALPADSQGKTPLATLTALFTDTATVTAYRLPATVLESSADHRLLGLTLAADATVCRGHFDAFPILPGVAQLDLAVRSAADWYPPTAFRRVEKLRFQESIIPGDTLQLQLQHTEAGRVSFEYRLDGRRLSSGQLVFGD